ncbi:hypothetical protein [uncultured Gimesia sp.]|uniref:hypothetical protein n=1 Tax=uncultured Gimesia sp. TaxID=1678688 RepID=UPI0030DB324A|tara:strand:- start:133785 stop:134453 length:669 start_codon:yes stop_codon:yes gene_type:complete
MNSNVFFSNNVLQLCRVIVVAVLINFTGGSLGQFAHAQNDPFSSDAERAKMTPEQQEAAAQELLKGVQKLVLSQQQRIARKVIRLYPKSESAKVAKLLLEEYERFSQLKEEEQQADIEWLDQVRNHWFKERSPVHNSCFFTILEGTQKSATTVINKSNSPVLYELKGPSMPWNGPFRLRIGESHKFYYSAQVRFFSDQGVVVKNLAPGQTLQLNEKNTLHIK